MAKRRGIQMAFGLAYLEAGGLPRFDFVEDAIIHIGKRWTDDPGEAIAVLADHVHAGFKPRSLGGGEQPGGFGAEFGIRLVQGIQQQKVAKVKYPGWYARKIQIIAAPKCVGSPGVEEGAPSTADLGHDVRVGSRGTGRGL